jgi:hypothetical protein
MTAESLKAKAKLYRPNVVVNWKGEPERGSVYGVGSRKYAGQNPPNGAQIYYSLTKKADKLGLKVLDYAGNTLQTMSNLKTEPGLHMVAWNATRQGGGPGGGGFGGRRVPAGTYRVVLTADGEEQSQPLRVEDDPNLPPGTIIAQPAEDMEDEKDEIEREMKEMKQEAEKRAKRIDY